MKLRRSRRRRWRWWNFRAKIKLKRNHLISDAENVVRWATRGKNKMQMKRLTPRKGRSRLATRDVVLSEFWHNTHACCLASGHCRFVAFGRCRYSWENFSFVWIFCVIYCEPVRLYACVCVCTHTGARRTKRIRFIMPYGSSRWRLSMNMMMAMMTIWGR